MVVVLVEHKASWSWDWRGPAQGRALSGRICDVPRESEGGVYTELIFPDTLTPV